CAWLPADMAITPRARSASESEISLLNAPRSLNELVTCRFSYLTCTEAPVSAESLGAASIGERATWPAMARRAASMSANVMLIRFPLALLPATRSRERPRASCPRTVYSPSAAGFDRKLGTVGHDRQWTSTDRRID